MCYTRAVFCNQPWTWNMPDIFYKTLMWLTVTILLGAIGGMGWLVWFGYHHLRLI